MTPKFDIFRIEKDGNVRWTEAVATLENAKALAQELAAQAPYGLVIFDQNTGKKHMVGPLRPLTGSLDSNAQHGRV